MPRSPGREGRVGPDDVGFEFGPEWYMPLLGGSEDPGGLRLGGGGFGEDGTSMGRRRDDSNASFGLGSQFDFSSLFGGTSGNTLQNTLMLLQLLQGGGAAGQGEELNLFSDISTGV